MTINHNDKKKHRQGDGTTTTVERKKSHGQSKTEHKKPKEQKETISLSKLLLMLVHFPQLNVCVTKTFLTQPNPSTDFGFLCFCC